MKTIAPETETEAEDSDFKPLTAQEAEQWRRRNPPVSPWKVVLGQSLVGVAVALVAWMWTQDVRAGWSAADGSLAVVVPAALFAYGVLRQKSAPRPGLAMLGFVGWKQPKIVLTIALLVAGAPGGARLELARSGGGVGDHNENVLGCTDGAARCSKNRLI